MIKSSKLNSVDLSNRTRLPHKTNPHVVCWIQIGRLKFQTDDYQRLKSIAFNQNNRSKWKWPFINSLCLLTECAYTVSMQEHIWRNMMDSFNLEFDVDFHGAYENMVSFSVVLHLVFGHDMHTNIVQLICMCEEKHAAG